MNRKDISAKIDIRPLKHSVRETPHATIEINRTCNLQCRCCYNHAKSTVKTLEKIRQEIDLLFQKRTPQTVTILGGEPTLHPDLEEVVISLKSRGVICQLLTNGVVFLDGQNDSMLDKLISAGIDQFIIHADNGQNHMDPDTESVREILFSKLEARRAHFSLSLTIYNEDAGLIPSFIKRYGRYRYFDGILAVLARDGLPSKTQKADLLTEYRCISQKLIVEPVAYIPSNLDDQHVSWLIYFYIMNAATKSSFDLSPRLYRIFQKLYRWGRGRQLFVVKFYPRLLRAKMLLVCLCELFMHPRKLRFLLKLTAGSDALRSIRFHYIAIQNPPETDDQKLEVRFCYHCPDATIRNGMLTPICLADDINPLPGSFQPPEIWENLRAAVYSHLGEI